MTESSTDPSDEKHAGAGADDGERGSTMLDLWSRSEPIKYVARDTGGVVAVRLDLATDGFAFEKWGGTQRCKRNDWLVHNLLDGDTYVVDDEVFKQTYRPDGPGRYKKTATVFAVEAGSARFVTTMEGRTDYEEGDFVVSHREKGSGLYAMPPCKFHEKYVRHDEHVAAERERTRIEREAVARLVEDAREERESVRRSLRRNRRLYNGLQITSIVASTLVPVAFVIGEYEYTPSELMAAVVGAVAMTSSAVQSFLRFSDKVVRDKLALDALKNLVRDAEGEADPRGSEEMKAKLKEIRGAREVFLNHGHGLTQQGGGDPGAAGLDRSRAR